jgi:hypothetical protein
LTKTIAPSSGAPLEEACQCRFTLATPQLSTMQAISLDIHSTLEKKSWTKNLLRLTTYHDAKEMKPSKGSWQRWIESQTSMKVKVLSIQWKTCKALECILSVDRLTESIERLSKNSRDNTTESMEPLSNMYLFWQATGIPSTRQGSSQPTL